MGTKQLLADPGCWQVFSRPALDHEPAGGFVLDRNREYGAGEGERAAESPASAS
jgi:hypothetical protein